MESSGNTPLLHYKNDYGHKTSTSEMQVSGQKDLTYNTRTVSLLYPKIALRPERMSCLKKTRFQNKKQKTYIIQLTRGSL